MVGIEYNVRQWVRKWMGLNIQKRRRQEREGRYKEIRRNKEKGEQKREAEERDRKTCNWKNVN